ncbi:MAG: tetratricopeptide repeat protein, partial [Candidatus Bipolaricaulota bacterium]
MGTRYETAALPSDGRRRLAAIMLTSIDGYAPRAQANEPLALSLLREQRAVLREALSVSDGVEIKAMRDRVLVSFPSAVGALQCAVSVQRVLHEFTRSASPERAIRLRIGIHLGDVVVRDGDIFGDGVNVASRIEPLAEPGGICLSQAVAEHVRGAAEYPLEDLGEHDLHNVVLPMRLFRVALPWLAVDSTAGATPDRLRVAVLPFMNISPDSGDAYLADGMTEELIHALSRVPQLHVIAPTSILRYRAGSKDVAEIGRELGVGTIVEGSVRKAGDRLRITAQLIDVATQEHFGSQAYDREMADIFAMQEEIARSVAETLELELAEPQTGSPAVPTSRADLEAYTWYLRGRHHLNRWTVEGREAALHCFRQAISLDGRYAAAYAGLSEAFLMRMDFGDQPMEEAYREGREAATRALEIDPRLVEAHTMLAMIDAEYDQNADEADRRLRCAIGIDPHYALARSWHAIVLGLLGRADEAREQITKALELDPASPYSHHAAGRLELLSGDLSAARNAYDEALRIDPGFPPAWGAMVIVKQLAWDWRGAAEAAATALEKGGHEPEIRELLADLNLQLGFADEAFRQMERAIALQPHSSWRRSSLALLCFFARRYDRAVAESTSALHVHTQDRRAHLTKALALGYSRRLDDALAAVDEADRIPGPTNAAMALALRGEILAHNGREAEALVIRDELARSARPREVIRGIAAISAGIGDAHDALDALDRALEWHVPDILWLRADPAWDPLRETAA